MKKEGEFRKCKIDIGCTVNNKVENNLDVNIFDVHKQTKFTKLEIDSLDNVEIDEIMDDD